MAARVLVSDPFAIGQAAADRPLLQPPASGARAHVADAPSTLALVDPMVTAGAAGLPHPADDLSDEQRQVVNLIFLSTRQLVLVIGPGGSGKTRAVRAVVNMYIKLKLHKIEKVVLLAWTASAAINLGNAVGASKHTLVMTVLAYIKNAHKLRTATQPTKSNARGLVVVDEIAMVPGSPDQGEITSAYDQLIKCVGRRKLLMLGDPLQGSPGGHARNSHIKPVWFPTSTLAKTLAADADAPPTRRKVHCILLRQQHRVSTDCEESARVVAAMSRILEGDTSQYRVIGAFLVDVLNRSRRRDKDEADVCSVAVVSRAAALTATNCTVAKLAKNGSVVYKLIQPCKGHATKFEVVLLMLGQAARATHNQIDPKWRKSPTTKSRVYDFTNNQQVTVVAINTSSSSLPLGMPIKADGSGDPVTLVGALPPGVGFAIGVTVITVVTAKGTTAIVRTESGEQRTMVAISQLHSPRKHARLALEARGSPDTRTISMFQGQTLPAAPLPPGKKHVFALELGDWGGANRADVTMLALRPTKLTDLYIGHGVSIATILLMFSTENDYTRHQAAFMRLFMRLTDSTTPTL
jgi:hypothetical protein